MKKVLFVASTGRHIINFHIPYIRHFRDLGWMAHVACGGEWNIESADETICLPFVKKMFAPENFRAMLTIRRQIKEHNYDLLLCHTSLAAFFARIALVGLRRRPAVCNMVHGYLFDDASSFLKKTVLTVAEKLTSHFTDLIICMNEYDRAFATEKKLAKRVEFVRGVGLDRNKYPEKSDELRERYRREFGFADDDFVMLYAAEFSQRKSQSVVIKAVTGLPDNVRLVLPGNGELFEQCREEVISLGLKERVVFPGHVKEMGPWYIAADAAVSGSRSEGLPFNLLEAMYYSLPIVASEVKGHTDLIDDGKSGLLYRYGDSMGCADRIMKLLEDKKLRERLRTEANSRVEKYFLENVEDEIMSLYLSTGKRDQAI